MHPNNQWPHIYRRYHFSLFWPIVLIGIGAILLLNNLNLLPGSLWDWASRLWPVILIAWGLDSLIRRQLVGSVLLIGLGVIFLLANLGWIALNPLEVIVRLWPVFLIAAGIGLIFDNRVTGLLGALFGAVLMLAILGGALWLTGVHFGVAESQPALRITQSLGRAIKANVVLEPNVGVVHVTAMAEPVNLVEGSINLQGSDTVSPTFSVEDGGATYRLKAQGVFVGLTPGSDWRSWDLKLNPTVPIALEIRMGAGDIDLDLSELQLSSLAVNRAVGTTTMTLPKQGRLSAEVNGAIGSTIVILPEGVGLRVQTGGLTVANVPPEFDKHDNTYTSPNFDNATNRVELNLNQALGSISIETR